MKMLVILVCDSLLGFSGETVVRVSAPVTSGDTVVVSEVQKGQTWTDSQHFMEHTHWITVILLWYVTEKYVSQQLENRPKNNPAPLTNKWTFQIIPFNVIGTARVEKTTENNSVFCYFIFDPAEGRTVPLVVIARIGSSQAQQKGSGECAQCLLIHRSQMVLVQDQLTKGIKPRESSLFQNNYFVPRNIQSVESLQVLKSSSRNPGNFIVGKRKFLQLLETSPHAVCENWESVVIQTQIHQIIHPIEGTLNHCDQLILLEREMPALIKVVEYIFSQNIKWISSQIHHHRFCRNVTWNWFQTPECPLELLGLVVVFIYTRIRIGAFTFFTCLHLYNWQQIC